MNMFGVTDPSPHGDEECPRRRDDSMAIAVTPAPSTRAWTVVDEPDGFRVEGGGRSVRVALRTTHWEIGSGPDPLGLPLQPPSLVLSQVIPRLIPPRMRDRPDEHRARRQDERRVRRAIGARVRRRVRRLLRRVDPLVLAVQRGQGLSPCDAEARGDDLLAMLPDLGWFRDEDVARDILAYPAAAIAAGNLDCLVDGWLRRLHGSSPDVAASAGDLVATTGVPIPHPLFASAAGHEVLRHWMAGLPLRECGALGAAMRHWPDLFSDGVGYGSLRRTLANLPGGMHDAAICALGNVHLPRPITDRLELLVVTSFANEYESSVVEKARLDRHAAVFLNARREQIERAMRRVGAHIGEPRPLSQGDVDFFVGYLSDYPEEHRGTIVGLADKVIAWHGHEQERQRRVVLAELGVSTRAARPPIPLPEATGVRFLGTVAEIVREGADMGHCVATYAAAAVDGRCYLFRVERGGEAATVLVDRGGSVGEASGPENANNRAARWGSHVLGRWGAAFSGPSRPSATGNGSTGSRENASSAAVDEGAVVPAEAAASGDGRSRMRAGELIDDLRRRGAEPVVDGGTLGCRRPAGTMPPEHRAALLRQLGILWEYERDVVELLRAEAAGRDPALAPTGAGAHAV